MIRIHREHHLGKDEARKRVADVADELCNQYGLSSSWAGDDLKFTGTGVNGCIVVSEQRVDVEVKLGFALSMMSRTIRNSIEGALTSHLLE
jgi:putative polyhydroxyalkanoate system protein